jgi:hypothetical protein
MNLVVVLPDAVSWIKYITRTKPAEMAKQEKQQTAGEMGRVKDK